MKSKLIIPDSYTGLRSTVRAKVKKDLEARGATGVTYTSARMPPDKDCPDEPYTLVTFTWEE